MASQKGMKTTWVHPWAMLTAVELRRDLLNRVASALEIEDQGRLRQAADWIEKKVGAARQVAGSLDWKLKVADAAFGGALQAGVGKLSRWGSKQVVSAIEEALRTQPLVVFVDDLDRIRPELLLDFLMVLRDALPFPRLFFVLGAAPNVVAEGLRSQHAGFEDPKRFLEKIIEYPTYLPSPSLQVVQEFIKTHVESLGNRLDVSALQASAATLPSNPRSLKLLLRLFAAFAEKLKRFSPGEIDVPKLYLLQGLRLEFPAIADAIAESTGANALLHFGSALRDEGDSKILPSPLLALAPPPEEPKRRERYIALCRAILSRHSHGLYEPRDLLRFVEFDPVLTRQEMGTLYDECDARSSGEIAQVLEGWIEGRDSVPVAVRTLFTRAVELRERLWDHVVEADSEADTLKCLERIPIATRILEVLLVHFRVVSDGRIGIEEWVRLYQHLALYSSWREPPEYLPVREDDLRLLALSVVAPPEGLWVEIVGLFSRETSGRDRVGEEFAKRVVEIRGRAAVAVVEKTLRRFSQPEGIAALWGDDCLTERSMAFAPESEFHSAAVWARLGEMAKEAKGDSVLHDNFLQFWRTLMAGGFGSFLGVSSFDCRKLLGDHEFVRIMWSGTVAQGLNRRIVGSLMEDRAKIVQALGVPLECFPTTDAFERMAKTLPTPATSPVAPEGETSAG